MKKLAILAALTFAAGAQAADIALLTPIDYDPSAGVVEKVKEECKLEQQLTKDTTEAFRKNKVGPAVTTLDGPGEVMKVRITYVFGVGGGGWTGPKSVTVHADVMKDGKVERTTRINRSSMGGVFGPFKGTCSILNRTSATIAQDLAKWAKDPAYAVVEEKPKDAPAEEPAASRAGT
jgi:hypothetical protein